MNQKQEELAYAAQEEIEMGINKTLKRLMSGGLAGAMLIAFTPATGAVLFTGELEASDGSMVTSGGLWDDSTLEWRVECIDGATVETCGKWKYSYSFWADTTSRDDPRDISNFILEVSPNFTLNNIMGTVGTNPGASQEGPQTFTTEFNESIFGLKWNLSSDSLHLDILFASDRAPMWGDFAAKDGNLPMQGGSVAAKNAGFGIDPAAAIGDEPESDWGWLLVPDTNGGPPQAVPVPPAVWLFGSGLVGLVGVARRRKS